MNKLQARAVELLESLADLHSETGNHTNDLCNSWKSSCVNQQCETCAMDNRAGNNIYKIINLVKKCNIHKDE